MALLLAQVFEHTVKQISCNMFSRVVEKFFSIGCGAGSLVGMVGLKAISD